MASALEPIEAGNLVGMEKAVATCSKINIAARLPYPAQVREAGPYNGGDRLTKQKIRIVIMETERIQLILRISSVLRSALEGTAAFQRSLVFQMLTSMTFAQAPGRLDSNHVSRLCKA